MAVVSVLVPTLNPGSALLGFVRSVDAQTVPATEFELVVVDASDDGSADRLQQLAGRRPNVTVLSADAERGEADRLGVALERATGEYLLVLKQEQRLAPRALELLLGRARRAGADVVLGRVVTEDASGCAVLPDDVDRLEVSEVDLTHCLPLVRRSLVAGSPGPGAALLDVDALVRRAGIVSAVGASACAFRDGAQKGPSTGASLEPPTYRWIDGKLHLTVAARLPEPVSPGLRAWLVASGDGAEVALPATTVTDERDGTSLTASAVLDPGAAEDGQPLADGPWDLLLRLAWPGREVTLPLGPGPAHSAVVAGRPYVLRAVGHAAQLDAGATEAGVIGRVPASRASVVESVHGALVTLEHPDLHVHGDQVLEARLLLDRLSLPARLVRHDGGARLEAYVGSLAGAPEVAVLAGGRKPAQTGLRLRVDGTGGMRLETVPARDPAASGISAAPEARLVQRLRRRLPGGLDPMVHRLARVPIIRKAYRRLISS